MFALQTPDVAEVAGAVDEVWLLVAAMLVMFMQAGFALVEAGFTIALRYSGVGSALHPGTAVSVFRTNDLSVTRGLQPVTTSSRRVVST